MNTRAAKSNAEEIAAIEDLLGDLEKRLRRLSSVTKREVSGASGEVSDFVSDALAGIMERVRESAENIGETVSDQASRVGANTVKKITDEVEQRPLVMLSIAAGLGFLVGMANRR
jgi:ElaB/YqjD/DUF883 family membrane-anchored ribosome-binding protein